MKILRSVLPLLLLSSVLSQDGDLELMAEGGGGTPNVIKLAGIYDTTAYYWSPDIFEVTVDLINQGWWGALPNTKDYRLEYSLENSNWYVQTVGFSLNTDDLIHHSQLSFGYLV